MTVRVPIMGTIAAGQPLPVPTDEGMDAAHAAESIAVTEDVLGSSHGQDLFALRVKGTSMIDALINDGDVVILEPATSVDDGEMAAVYLRDANEVTLKKFFREGERVRLQPMNEDDAADLHGGDQCGGSGPGGHGDSLDVGRAPCPVWTKS